MLARYDVYIELSTGESVRMGYVYAHSVWEAIARGRLVWQILPTVIVTAKLQTDDA